MITVFSTLKPGYGYRQHNAVKSWSVLPRSHVLLVGEESRPAAEEFGTALVIDVRRSDSGIPQLDSLFEVAEAWGDDLFLYVNADIVLWPDIILALEMCAERFPKFLMIGRRTDLSVSGPVEEYDRLRRVAVEQGGLLSPCGCDYFGFTRGLWPEIPPYAIGRTSFDNWLINAALEANEPVIDVTKEVTAVHQEHPINNLAEAESNQGLVPGIGKGLLGWVTDSSYVY